MIELFSDVKKEKFYLRVALSSTKDYVQDAELRFAAGLRDLSASRLMMYSELFKERIQN